MEAFKDDAQKTEVDPSVREMAVLMWLRADLSGNRNAKGMVNLKRRDGTGFVGASSSGSVVVPEAGSGSGKGGCSCDQKYPPPKR